MNELRGLIIRCTECGELVKHNDHEYCGFYWKDDADIICAACDPEGVKNADILASESRIRGAAFLEHVRLMQERLATLEGN